LKTFAAVILLSAVVLIGSACTAPTSALAPVNGAPVALATNADSLTPTPVVSPAPSASPSPEDSQVEKIKRLASDALAADYTTRQTDFGEIADGLKDLLTANQLDSSTFTDAAFSVTVENYPLKKINGTVQKITFVLGDETDSFLRYNGDTSFFSDYFYAPDNPNVFRVIEADDACYAVSAFPDGTGSETYGLAPQYSNWQTTVLRADGGAFTQVYKDYPSVKVADGYTLDFVKQDGKIEAVVNGRDGVLSATGTDGQYDTGYFFDGTNFVFGKNSWTGYSNSDMPGLLLGLSDTAGNLRTLFIHKDGGSLIAENYPGKIIFNRGGELDELSQYTYHDGNEQSYPFGQVDVKKLLCGALGSDAVKNFVPDYTPSDDDNYFPFYSTTDIPLCVGNDYICYIQQSWYSYGGSMNFYPVNIRFDKLDDLSNFSWNGSELVPNFDSATLADFIFGGTAKALLPADADGQRTYAGTPNPYVDFSQLTIKRNVGKWSLMLPVMTDYYHPGNGSSANYILSFAAFNDDVPGDIVSHAGDMAVPTSWDYSYAKDVVAFPGGETFLAQRDYQIDVCGVSDDTPALTVPVNLDEYIVSISFAADAAQEQEWQNELNR